MVFVEIINKVQEKLVNWGFSAVDFVPNLFLAIIILILGIFIGKFVKWLLSKLLIKGFKLDNIFKFGFIDTTLIAVKWAVYILFFQYSLTTLQLPFLSNYLMQGLGIIPGLIGAAIIAIVGYAIASFLKKGFERTEKSELTLLGNILFVFILYISLTLSLISAFSGIEGVTNNTILIISALAIAGFIWLHKEYFKYINNLTKANQNKINQE